MKRWGNFSTLKERGEWVELQFMAAAASRGYHVLKPYGDSLAYDVGIDHGGRLMRVQVKSTSVRMALDTSANSAATISPSTFTWSKTSTSSPPTSSR